MKRTFSVTQKINPLIERPSIQFLAVALTTFFILILLPIIIVILIPAESYAFFGEMGLYLFVGLILAVFVLASFITTAVWSRICKNMLEEKPDAKGGLIEAHNFLSFLLWALTGILGLISLGLGLIPNGHDIQQINLLPFLFTSTFFSYTLAVEYVLRFKLKPER